MHRAVTRPGRMPRQLLSGIRSIRLFCARDRVLWPQASNDRWRLRKYLALACLAVRQNRSWRGLHALHVLSALFAVKPAYILPSHTHTASSDIKKVLVLDQLQAPPCHWLRTIWKRIWKSRAAQAFATTIDWRSDGVSNRSSTRKLDRRLSGTRTGVRVAESCAKRLTASRWWTRKSLNLKWCMSKLGKFSLQVTMVLWILFRTRLTKKHLFQNRKFSQSGLREVLTAVTVKPRCQGNCRCFHALSAKAGATFTWFCLRVMSREEISMPAKSWPTMLQGIFPDPRKL